MSKWAATTKTWCTRCIIRVRRSMVCISTVKSSCVLIRSKLSSLNPDARSSLRCLLGWPVTGNSPLPPPRPSTCVGAVCTAWTVRLHPIGHSHRILGRRSVSPPIRLGASQTCTQPKRAGAGFCGGRSVRKAHNIE